MRLWRSRTFLLLWGGQTAGEVGARISGVAVPLLAATVLHASVLQVSLLTLLAWAPYLVFSLPAGVLADRADRRRLMIACDLGRAVLMLSLPVVALTAHLTLALLYVVVSLTGVLTVLFTVAYRTELPPADRPGAAGRGQHEGHDEPGRGRPARPGAGRGTRRRRRSASSSRWARWVAWPPVRWRAGSADGSVRPG